MVNLPSVWREPMRLFSNIDQLFERLNDEATPLATGFGRTDIYEKDEKLYFELELPGLKKENVQVKIEDRMLVVKGKTERDEQVKNENYYRMERRYGSFQKCFPLPEQAQNPENVKAQFENGILKIILPLREPLKGRSLDIAIE